MLKVKFMRRAISNFYKYIFLLKRLKRTGWYKYWGVDKKESESVAEHSFATALLAYIIAQEYKPELNLEKILSLALIHDLAESIVGDIPLRDNFPKDEKHILETNAIQDIFKDFVNRDKFLAIWKEYEEGKTPEAKFVKEIDKLEFVFQAFWYKKENFGIRDAEEKGLNYFEYAEKLFSDDAIVSILKLIKKNDSEL